MGDRNAPFAVIRNMLRRTGLGTVAAALLPRLPDPLARLLRRLRLELRVRGGERLVDEAELEALYRRALERIGPESAGDYLEFGVYVGTSMACMHRASVVSGARHIRLIGFDSFEGLPEAAREDDEGYWAPGAFDSDLDFRHLESQGVDLDRVTLVPGWFDETLTEATRAQHAIDKAAVIMVDCDLSSSARTALEFACPAIVDEAVVVFDDWHAGDLAMRGLGERRAFEDFLAAHPEFVAEEFASYPPHGRAFTLTRHTDD